MRTGQLAEVICNLDQQKRIKFQNRGGWENQTMAVNALLEQGNAYIFIWAHHPALVKEQLQEGQKLIWYNPNCPNFKHLEEYFPQYYYKVSIDNLAKHLKI